MRVNYRLYIKPDLYDKITKLKNKNKEQANLILTKVEEILKDPHSYRNLRAPLDNWKKVNVDEYFVLLFSVDEELKTVTLEDYDCADNIYQY
jgi:mRNA-degrading endonuclease RelE of RelBE toxin-antitoxin system